MKIFDHPVWIKTITWIKNIKIAKINIKQMKVFDHPVWIKTITWIKNIKIANTNIKQLTALLLLVFFLTTGMLSSIETATAEETMAAAEISASKVILNGKVAGYVCDPVSAQIIMEEVLREAAQIYRMDVTSSHKLTFEEVSVTPDQLSTKDELESALRKYSDIKVNAIAIYADNNKIGILKSEEEAQQLLEQVKSRYIEDISKLEEAGFQEEVTIVSTPVDYYEVQTVEAIAEEIQKGFETVEEYTIQQGDTLWSISRAFGIKIDDLKEMNPELKENPDKLKLGQILKLSFPKSLLNVVTTELIDYEKSIPYETETKKDDSMYTTQTKVLQKGEEGLKKVEARVYKVNGKETRREVISETVIKEPVNKIVAQGTKKAPSYSSRGSSSSSGGGSGRLAWPIKGTITSRFGTRWGRLHKGIDIANKKGTPIYAAESGKVIFSGWQGGYGNLVQIDHGGGMVTFYAHMSKRAVSVGATVSRGQLIGYVGSTGNSTGPHLHFEVRINDSPKNPLNYLK
ncbi:MAG TPA: peptidoglycan DD-metalloendopeptidase family protein [Clostridiales bacterium]|nr:peptidoglycan DD-metalloendopeptidase family protein [Clostridiales bacterium]